MGQADTRQKLQDQALTLYKAELDGVISSLGRTLAHDLNNHLAAIAGYAMLLQSELEGQNVPLARAEKIESLTQEAMEAVQTLAQKTVGKSFDLETLDLRTVLETSIELAKLQTGAPLPVVLDLADTIKVRSNQMMLMRCLVNSLTYLGVSMAQPGDVHIRIEPTPNMPKKSDAALSFGYPAQAAAALIEMRHPTGSSEDFQSLFDDILSEGEGDMRTRLGLLALKTFAEENLAFIAIEDGEDAGVTLSFYLMEPQSA